jgi:hypothetical protein
VVVVALLALMLRLASVPEVTGALLPQLAETFSLVLEHQAVFLMDDLLMAQSFPGLELRGH